MKGKCNYLLLCFLSLGIFFTNPLQAQDIPPFIGEGPLTIIDSSSTAYELPFCANESFQVPLPGGICVEGTFEVDPPDLLLIENLGADGFKFTPLAEVTATYTSDSRTCEDGTVIEAATYTYYFFPNPICSSEPSTPSEYLYAFSFCEGEVPAFFPDPPTLKFPCIGEGCSVSLVDVRGVWEPINGGEPFPPLNTTEYQIRYFLPGCPAPDCELIEGSPAAIAFNEAMMAYNEGSAKYDGQLGLIEINNCQEEISEEDADLVITICQGDSVVLEGYNNPVDCPCGAPTGGPVDCFPFPQPGGVWTANGIEVCSDCINQTVSPQTTTLYTNLTPGFQCPLPPLGSGPQGPRPPAYPAGPVINVLVVVEDCGEQSSERVLLEELLEVYPWAAELVQSDACGTNAVTVYTDGNFEYVLIEEELTASLYLEDGSFLCAQSPNFNCLSFYNLSTIQSQWTCSSTGNSIGANLPSTCTNNLGNIFFEQCDDGREFFFARTTDGQVLDIYFDEGLEFEYYDGQPIQFDFRPADFPSPCSIADQAVIVTCIEEIFPTCDLLSVIDLIDNLCDNCLTEIALYAFEGETYLVSIADNDNCADGLTTVINCSNGENFCMDGGFAGFTQCDEFFEGALKLESIVKENCGGCICPAVFLPVCGEDGITYGNECEAACAGVAVVGEGVCSLGNVCEITIANTQCRRVGIFDVSGNLLTIMNSGPFGNAPVGTPTPMWTDPNPLVEGEERIYIFKENDFELGRTVATCATPEIDTRNSFAAGCNDGLSLGIYTNTGCRNVDIFQTNGTIISSLAPNQSATLTATNFIYIAVAEGDTIAIFSDRGGDINSGGCEEDCFCIALFDPVCGIDGRTYGNECEAACAGVEVAFRGECADVLAPPCIDVAGVDFGLCEAIMGVAVVNGECTFVSGCGNFVVEGIDYTEAFFPSVEICAQECQDLDPIFVDFPWLSDIVDPTNCTDERISVYQLGAFFFIYVETASSQTLYFQDGTFYCESAPNFDCLEIFELTSLTASWSCQSEVDCNCPALFDPVCGVDGNTYGNECEAFCAGVDIAYLGECNCICTDDFTPVCGVDGKTYSNACQAACEGVEVASDGECEAVCLCPAVALPVCGVDGNTYINECEAACVGVEVAFDGICEPSIAEPCTDLVGVDFGDCRAVMGIGIVNGQCSIVSGCFEFIVDGVDYSEAFFPSVELCAQSCPTPPGDPIFADYPWLVEVVDPTNCQNDKVTVYQSGVHFFLYVENAAGSTLYFQDGTFYCQDSEGLDCRAAYNLTNIVASWSCSGGAICDNPLAQEWLQSSLDNECTGKIYTIDYNGSTAIYVSTLCGCLDDADMVFTCEGDFLCSVGRIAPDSRCMPDPANQLTDANLIWSPDCECECPASKEPVCGVDGNTYLSACDATCAGVEIRSNEACELTTTLTPPCYDVAGVDFGPCDAVLGVAIVNGNCTTLSGCDIRITRIDYSASFFPTVEICQQTCGEASEPEIFTEYPWLSDLIDPTNCEDEQVTVYQSNVHHFLYVQRGTSAELYYQDGTFYCRDGENRDCRSLYNLTEVSATWTCNSVDNREVGPLFIDYPWLLDIATPNTCLSKSISEFDVGNHSFIYIFESAANGTLYLDDGTFYCQDRPHYNCLEAYGLRTDMIARTWRCLEGMVYDDSVAAAQRSKAQAAYFTDALTVFPNPTRGQFNIQINSISKEPQILTVVDLYGRILQEHTLQSDAQKLSIPVDLSIEPDGLYMVVLKASGQAAIRKTVVKSGL